MFSQTLITPKVRVYTSTKNQHIKKVFLAVCLVCVQKIQPDEGFLQKELINHLPPIIVPNFAIIQGVSGTYYGDPICIAIIDCGAAGKGQSLISYILKLFKFSKP